MKVLGIHSLTHDSGVALYEDGRITHAVEEERLTRLKHYPGIEVGGEPPYKSLDYVLKESNLKLEDIDTIVHVGWPGNDFMHLDLIRRLYRDFARKLDPEAEKTQFVDHHLSHAASAYYASGFEKSLVLVVDGSGDWLSTSLYTGEGRVLRKVDEYFLDQSLGIMYSRAAKLLGLGDFGFGEGKLTALTAYGSPLQGFPSIVDLEGGRYQVNPGYYEHFKRFRRPKGTELIQEHCDFAATVQNALVKAILYVLDGAHQKYDGNNLCLAGGVALNCTMNGKIRRLPWIRKLFIQPAANDGGLCVGAAYLGAAARAEEGIEEMESIYLGPAIDPDEVDRFIKSSGLRARQTHEPHEYAAERLAQGKIVAWMQGRLELGPRALGHRSLLGDPRNMEVRDKMNVSKGRESWRPVAPSLIEGGERYCGPSEGLEYMTTAVEMTPLAAQEIPAALHADGTARLQMVRDQADPFYRLINAFYQRTGIPAVLNTSLNGKGEPLCTSIEDGVKFFYTTPTDDLFVGNWWISKEKA